MDGISNTVHPRCRFVYLPPLVVSAAPRSAACRGSPERRRAGLPIWDDFLYPVRSSPRAPSDESHLGACVVTPSFLLDGSDTTSSALIRFFWRVSTVRDVED